MDKNEENQEKGFGKYILINRIMEKFSKSFLAEEERDRVIINTAVLLEGIHFSLVYFPLKHLGYKSVVSSIAGIYDKKGIPETVSVNLGIGSKYNQEDIETIMEGVDIACQNYNLKMAGFNIDSSLTGLTLAVTSAGIPDSTLDSESEPADTDLVCVTGDLGAAYMGLQLLERERKLFEQTGGTQPQLEGFEYVIGRQLKPEIEADIFTKIRETGIKPTAVRVIKEGLASDIIWLAHRYDKGCRIYHDKIPYTGETANAGNEFNIEPIISALNGGDDYEVLLTFPVSDFEKLEKIEGLTIVGHLTDMESGYTLALHDNSLAELKAQGWESI